MVLVIDHYSMRRRGETRREGVAGMSMQTELNTITSTMTELSARITALVESEGNAMAPDVYSELVAAERTVGALLRRLTRVAGRSL
jgi:outer membrane murein-binding lipoprotein Lpp